MRRNSLKSRWSSSSLSLASRRLEATPGAPSILQHPPLGPGPGPGSPCIDSGGFLTRATNAGQDSTDLEVEDAGYFFDGYGIVEVDLIQPPTPSPWPSRSPGVQEKG